MKYNYVILGSSSDLYKFSYSDLEKTNKALYIPGIESNLNTIESFLFRFHTWRKLNKMVTLPYKNAWNKLLLGKVFFRDDNKLCFIFISNWVEYENDIHLITYLRNTFDGCKLVWFLQDIISTRVMKDGNPLPIDELRKKFDLVISFDQNDCEQYGLIYHHLVFSSYTGVIKEMPYSDVYFVGKAKNRWKEIIKTYETIKAYGLTCDFHISGVAVDEQLYKDDIDYNPHISYYENLQHILHTKCILEIMQQGGVGFTQRGCEAVCLNRKLLTNNSRITEAPFYNPQYISTFSNGEDIDVNFLLNIPKSGLVDYKYKQEFSPFKFIDFIESKLDV